MTIGSVYLLHFSRPIGQNHTTQHYLGWSADLDNRIRQHRKGTGSRLCAVARERDIFFTVAQVWQGNRRLERYLKSQHNAPRYCPICAANKTSLSRQKGGMPISK